VLGLNQTAKLLRPSTTQDSYGAPTHTWATIVSSMPCRLVALPYGDTAQLKALGAAEHSVASHKLYSEYLDMRPADRVEVGGDTYRVIAAEDVDVMGHHTEAMLARIEGVGP
jgi:hypothetical protein